MCSSTLLVISFLTHSNKLGLKESIIGTCISKCATWSPYLDPNGRKLSLYHLYFHVGSCHVSVTCLYACVTQHSEL